MNLLDLTDLMDRMETLAVEHHQDRGGVKAAGDFIPDGRRKSEAPGWDAATRFGGRRHE